MCHAAGQAAGAGLWLRVHAELGRCHCALRDHLLVPAKRRLAELAAGIAKEAVLGAKLSGARGLKEGRRERRS